MREARVRVDVGRRLYRPNSEKHVPPGCASLVSKITVQCSLGKVSGYMSWYGRAGGTDVMGSRGMCKPSLFFRCGFLRVSKEIDVLIAP